MPLRSPRAVLILLIPLAIIMYLDRICISIAGPRMQEAFGISPKQWGLVLGAFTLSYALFEIPGGRWGDRFGARRTLTRIVLWWSAFTMLSALATGYWSLVAIRFLFGAGEAGALPNISIVLSRYFPAAGRAQAMGIICMAMQAGAFLAPFLVVALQQHWGWQASFFVFGGVGILWAISWYLLYRDELGTQPHTPAPHSLDPKLFRDPDVLASMYIGFCYVFGLSWFIFWMPTFLIKGRSFTETQLLWTSLPPIAGALANLLAGWASDRAVRTWGLLRGRKNMGLLGLLVATLALLAVTVTSNPAATIALLAASYAGIAFQQTVILTTVVDIGGPNVGSILGAVNMAATLGGLVCSVSFGYFVEGFHSYTFALLPMAAILASGAFAWAKLRLSPISSPVPQPHVSL